jgi:hypothetical protein
MRVIVRLRQARAQIEARAQARYAAQLGVGLKLAALG